MSPWEARLASAGYWFAAADFESESEESAIAAGEGERSGVELVTVDYPVSLRHAASADAPVSAASGCLVARQLVSLPNRGDAYMSIPRSLPGQTTR